MTEQLKAIKTTDGVNEAMGAIVNLYSPKPIEERFDDLIQQIIAFSFFCIDRQRETGQRTEEHEQDWIDDSMKHLKNIEKMLATAKKYGRLSPKPNPNFDAQVIDKIDGYKKSVGEIVRKIPQNDQSTGTEESVQG